MAMPNVQMERYKYTISDIILTAEGFEEPITVRKNFIRSFSQYNNYDNAISPKILLSFEIEKEYYESIILNMNTLVATFTINKVFIGYITKSKEVTDEIEQEHIWKEVTLKAVNDDNISINNANKLMDNSEYKIEAADNSQQTVPVNLLLYDNKNIEKYRKNNYFIINGGKNDVVYNFLKHRDFTNILMTPTDNISNTYSIPYGHMGDNLYDLNRYYGLYKTPYLFFMDLDTIYLLEKGKVGNTLKKDELKTVSIYLNKQSSSDYINCSGSYVDLDNNMYILNAATFEIVDNDSTIDYAVGGTVKTVIGGTGEVKTDKFGDYNIERTVVVDNEFHHSQLVYNIKEQKRSVVLTFENIDLSIITPNKKYTILPDETFYNNKYNIKGDYRLTSMRLLLKRTGDYELKSSIQIFLNKIPD